MTERLVALVLLLGLALPAAAAPLALEVRGHRIDFSPFSVVAESGEALRLLAPGQQLLSVTLDGQPLPQARAGEAVLRAPADPGLYRLRLVNREGDASELNLFVTVPAELAEDGALNGYRIGPQPPGHPAHPQHYDPPAGYVEVTPELLDTRLSPHFTLRQFLCKQSGGYPKYLALRESLLVLLEGLLAEVNAAGYAARTFGVISAYRTPWYNRSIGNVPNSRHVYGDAMDLFIDLDGDGRLDDLDGDGDRDPEDVAVLAGIAEDFMARYAGEGLMGGVGRYRPVSHHGGFVHVDTRGFPARW